MSVIISSKQSKKQNKNVHEKIIMNLLNVNTLYNKNEVFLDTHLSEMFYFDLFNLNFFRNNNEISCMLYKKTKLSSKSSSKLYLLYKHSKYFLGTDSM